MAKYLPLLSGGVGKYYIGPIVPIGLNTTSATAHRRSFFADCRRCTAAVAVTD